jgi:hypothetical protein
MNIPENEVSAFISYGEKKCMYTLWVIVDRIYTVGKMQRKERYSRYVKNLSTDKETAIDKAVEYASEHGIEFVSTTNADALLNEIERRTAEEMEAVRAKAQQEAEEAEQRAIEERDRKIEEMVVIFEEQFDSDKFTFGKHQGSTFEEVMQKDSQYIRFILDNNEECPFEFPRTLTEMCINSLYAYVQENGYPKNPLDDSEYVGNYKERIEIKVKVIGKSVFQTQFGFTTLYKFMDDENNLLVTFYSGSTWSLDRDEEAFIVGTVDKHEVYNNVKQTTLKRVKVK